MEKVPTLVTKESIWLRERQEVDKITDSLGLTVDEGIKDAVIALRLLGVNTSSSHEGKIDRHPIPYIDIKSVEAQKLEKLLGTKIKELMTPEEKLIREQIDSLDDRLVTIGNPESQEALEMKRKIEELESRLLQFESPEHSEITKLQETIEIENLNERKKIDHLLNLFYKDRVVSDEVKLVIEPMGLGRSRLQSKGAERQEVETNQEEKIRRLQGFQAEMNNFTEFLKKIFFEKN